MNAGDNFWEQEEGLVFPAQNALVAQQHMLKYGTTHDDLSLIAFKNHHNGSLHPKARFYGKKVTMEEIKKSPIVSTPFNLYDCSISVNGAAAVLISNDKSNVQVEGSALAADYLAPFEREDMTIWNGTVIAGKEAFKQAGVRPEDINVAELHDAFSIVELIAYEDLGFCKKGQGGKFVEDGHTDREGVIPTNMSGGLKAVGHPVGASGVREAIDVVRQLREDAPKSVQVDDAEIGMSHNVGGSGATVLVHLFKRGF